MVEGPGGGIWTVVRDTVGWGFTPDDQEVDNVVTLDMDTTWRLCTRAVTPDIARSSAAVAGDRAVTHPALDIILIIRTAKDHAR